MTPDVIDRFEGWCEAHPAGGYALLVLSAAAGALLATAIAARWM